MDKLAALPIDWANVNWPYFLALVVLVFACTFVGTALSMQSPSTSKTACRRRSKSSHRLFICIPGFRESTLAT